MKEVMLCHHNISKQDDSILASLCKQDGILLDRFCRTSYGFLFLKSGGRRTILSKWSSTKRNDLMYNQYDM